jgi:hypothetical protein
MWCHVTHVITDISEECVASIIRVTRISELGTLAVSSIRSTLATRSSETSVLTTATRSNIPEEGILHCHRRIRGYNCGDCEERSLSYRMSDSCLNLLIIRSWRREVYVYPKCYQKTAFLRQKIFLLSSSCSFLPPSKHVPSLELGRLVMNVDACSSSTCQCVTDQHPPPPQVLFSTTYLISSKSQRDKSNYVQAAFSSCVVLWPRYGCPALLEQSCIIYSNANRPLSLEWPSVTTYSTVLTFGVLGVRNKTLSC